MKRFTLLLSALAVAVGSSLFILGSSSVANASSAYDANYITTTDWSIKRSGCTDTSIMSSWRSVVESSSYASSFTSNSTYGYFVSAWTSGTTRDLVVGWGAGSLDWVTASGSGRVLSSGGTYSAHVGFDASCNVTVLDTWGGYAWVSGGAVSNIFYIGNTNLPSGYEGTSIITTDPSAVPTNLVYTTDDYHISSNNYYGMSYAAVDVSSWVIQRNNSDWYRNYSGTPQAAWRDNFNSIITSSDYSSITVKYWTYQSGDHAKYASFISSIVCPSKITITYHASDIQASCSSGGITSTVYQEPIYYGSGSNRPVYTEFSAPGYQAMTIANGTDDIQIIESYNLNNVEPSGYTGVSIPGAMLEPLNIYPDARYSVISKSITIEDKSLSFPEAWGNWHMRYDFYDTDGTTLLYSTDQPGGSSVDYMYDDFGTYKVTLTFLTPDNTVYPDSIAQQTFLHPLNLSIVIDGSSYTSDSRDLDCTDGDCPSYTPYQTCFTTELPFIDLPGCWHNLGVVGSMLSFDKIRIGTDFGVGGSCRTLGTLGDWLGLSNKMVCPQFPSGIRDTVTPFVTFALALMIVSYIVTRVRSGRSF